jgi:hypothetical protein
MGSAGAGAAVVGGTMLNSVDSAFGGFRSLSAK